MSKKVENIGNTYTSAENKKKQRQQNDERKPLQTNVGILNWLRCQRPFFTCTNRNKQ